MFYRYELYREDGSYARCEVLTGFRLLYGTSVSDEHIRRIVKPFTRDLDFPILKDKSTKSTSLFTEEGNRKFMLDIIAARKTYEDAAGETGLVMKLIEISEKEVAGRVLYEDENQVLVDERCMNKLRVNLTE